MLWVQDWMSEHCLPDDTSAIDWQIESVELQPFGSETAPSYNLALRIRNAGAETLQSATLAGTLYECAAPDDPIDRCTPVGRSRDYLALDLGPGFVHHLRIYPAFHHAGGPNPRVRWVMTDIVADRDAAGG
jgi:hypothetical protein